MITFDESKFKRSDVTLYDKDGNPIGVAKNVIISSEDDDSYTLTDSEVSLLKNYYNNKTFAFSINTKLSFKEKVKQKFALLKDNIKARFFHPYDKRPLYKRLLGYCNCPNHKRHWFIYPKTIRMNTSYKGEKLNYVTCCEEFYESEIAPQIDELWDFYYSTRF